MDFKVTYEYENEVIAHKITKYNVSKVSEKFIIITDDKLYGVININGDIITPLVYSYISNFKNGVAIVKRDRYYGLINKFGNVIVPLNYYDINYIGNGYYQARKKYNSTFDVIDSNGNIIKERLEFNYAYFNENSIILLFENSVSTLYDKQFNQISKHCHYISSPKNGILAFDICTKKEPLIKTLYGVMDENGSILIQPKYKCASIIDNNRIMVITQNNKVRIIDNNGKVIKKIHNRLDYIKEFVGEIAICKLNDKYGLIDVDGNIIYDIKCDYIEYLSNGQYLIYRNNKCGIIDSKGKIVIDISYKNIKLLDDGNYCLYLYNQVIITTNKGEVIFTVSNCSLEDVKFGYIIKRRSNTSKNLKVTLLDKKGNNILTKDNVIDYTVVNDFIIWHYLGEEELTDKIGNVIIPLVKDKINVINNHQVMLSNKLVDLNQEYLDINYIITIKYNDYILKECFKTNDEREKFKTYFQTTVIEEINKLYSKNDLEIKKLNDNLKKNTHNLVSKSKESFQKKLIK